MKKDTLISLYNYFVEKTGDLDPAVVNDICAEYNKIITKANEKINEYELAKPFVFSAIADAPLTAKEIFCACEDNLPEGFTANKIQYGLLHYWVDEIIKIDNGRNPYTYRIK